MNFPKIFWLRSIILYTVTKLASIFKVSCIIGSYTAWFSMLALVMPLTGAWAGIAGSSTVFGLGLIVRMLMTGFSLPLHYLAYHIPGLFAAYYWASPSWLIRVCVPVSCMILFIVHPVGSQAWPYAMYWWIPVALTMGNQKSLFSLALGSTFTAHAVGSVIWLYTMPMAAAHWLGLIPVVCVERFTFAFGMVILYQMVKLAARCFSRASIHRLSVERI